MASFKIKRGIESSANTSNILPYELGWATDNGGYLLINNNATVMRIRAGFADSATNATNATNATLAANATNADNADLLGSIAPGSFLRSDVDDFFTAQLLTINNDLTVLGTATLTATSATYADVAEKYSTDAQYEAGTVLMFGKEVEGTIANGTAPVLGVVSTLPAHLLNAEIQAEFSAAIALTGRVPVKVTGEVLRGEYVVVDLDNPGFGVAGDSSSAHVIGICVTGTADSESGFCEVKV